MKSKRIVQHNIHYDSMLLSIKKYLVVPILFTTAFKDIHIRLSQTQLHFKSKLESFGPPRVPVSGYVGCKFGCRMTCPKVESLLPPAL